MATSKGRCIPFLCVVVPLSFCLLYTCVLCICPCACAYLSLLLLTGQGPSSTIAVWLNFNLCCAGAHVNLGVLRGTSPKLQAFPPIRSRMASKTSTKPSRAASVSGVSPSVLILSSNTGFRGALESICSLRGLGYCRVSKCAERIMRCRSHIITSFDGPVTHLWRQPQVFLSA